MTHNEKLEVIHFVFTKGIQDLRHTLKHASPLSHEAKIVLKLYKEELFENNIDLKIDLEKEQSKIYQFVNQTLTFLDTITFKEIDGFEEELEKHYQML